MPTIFRGVCEVCGQPYEGRSERWCSVQCAARGRGAILKEIADAAPRFVDYRVLDNDEPWAVTCDWHVPAFDPEITELLFATAQTRGVRQLLVLGDFLDFETLSCFDRDNWEATLEGEIDAARALLKLLTEQFDKVVWIVGNHERRLNRKLGFAMRSHEGVAKLVCADLLEAGLIEISRYPFLFVETPLGRYLACHPKSYSDIAGTVPEKLASIHGCHVLSTHGHHVGFRFDPSGKYVCWDIGGMFSGDKVAYSQLSMTTHRAWGEGFGVLDAGHYQQYTLHPAFTAAAR